MIKQNDTINQLLQKTRKDKEKNDYDMSIMNLKIMNTKEGSIKKLNSAKIKNNSISIFVVFGQSNINFIKSIELYIRKNKSFRRIYNSE